MISLNLEELLKYLRPLKFVWEEGNKEDYFDYPSENRLRAEGIIEGYIARILYDGKDIEKAYTEAKNLVDANWDAIIDVWKADIEPEKEHKKESNYSSLTKLYE